MPELKANFQENRTIDRLVEVDMDQDITDLYPEGTIRTKKFTGGLVAEVESGKHPIGIFRGEARNGRPAVVALDGGSVSELKPGEYVQVRNVGLMVQADLSRLAIENMKNRHPVLVTGHVYPGVEPFENSY